MADVCLDHASYGSYRGKAGSSTRHCDVQSQLNDSDSIGAEEMTRTQRVSNQTKTAREKSEEDNEDAEGDGVRRVEVEMEKRKEEMEGTWEEPGAARVDDDRPMPVAGWPLCTLQNKGRGEYRHGSCLC